MVDNGKRTIYYVSNLNTGRVSLIDGYSKNTIKEIEIGSRPQNIIIDENDNVFIASDRNNQVTVINADGSTKILNIPNNGNIEVDLNNKKFYASNTEEIYIYNLESGEKIISLKGFTAADRLELDKEGKRLFVLDILQNAIKVYDTESLKLIDMYKNIGTAPVDILLGLDLKCIYIANKGSKSKHYSGNISILDINTKNLSYIYLSKGSSVVSLEQSGSNLYVANSGLNCIEVIDIHQKQCISMIKTTLPIIERIRLFKDKKILYAISRNNHGKSVIDIIDTNKCVITDTLFLKENSLPYDIGVVIQKEPQIEEEPFVLMNLDDKLKKENGITILAKEVLSVSQEKLIFSQMSIELFSMEFEIINIEEILFGKCEMINETMKFKILNNSTGCTVLHYEFYIPYYITARCEQDHTYSITGKIEGTHEAKLYIPNYAKEQDLQFEVSAFMKLISTPLIMDNKLEFNVSALISTKVLIDKIIFFPSCKIYEVLE